MLQLPKKKKLFSIFPFGQPAPTSRDRDNTIYEFMKLAVSSRSDNTPPNILLNLTKFMIENKTFATSAAISTELHVVTLVQADNNMEQQDSTTTNTTNDTLLQYLMKLKLEMNAGNKSLKDNMDDMKDKMDSKIEKIDEKIELNINRLSDKIINFNENLENVTYIVTENRTEAIKMHENMAKRIDKIEQEMIKKSTEIRKITQEKINMKKYLLSTNQSLRRIKIIKNENYKKIIKNENYKKNQKN